uniref:Uncharacterized protein n=1 Tax=Globodera pallida TaxID=36090 RepID=A0A183CAF1_GLOPA
MRTRIAACWPPGQFTLLNVHLSGNGNARKKAAALLPLAPLPTFTEAEEEDEVGCGGVSFCFDLGLINWE